MLLICHHLCAQEVIGRGRGVSSDYTRTTILAHVENLAARPRYVDCLIFVVFCVKKMSRNATLGHA